MKITIRTLTLIPILFVLTLLLHPYSAQAGTVAVVTPDRVWQTWNWDVPLFFAMMVGLSLYNRGLTKLWRRVGFGRGVRYWQVAAFITALLTIFIALISPLEALSHALFSMHMLQHMLLIMVAAPLLVVSGFQTAFLAGLPYAWQYRLGRIWGQSAGLRALWQFVNRPVVSWTTGVAIIWVWHIPLFYEAALNHDAIHVTEHLLFLLTSMLFWWPLLKPAQLKHQTYGIHVFYLFLATLQGTVLGALMTFTNQPWYAAYTSTAPLWNVTPLQDQQLAGVIMWLPGSLLYLAGTLIFFVIWLDALEKRMQSPYELGVKLAERK